MREYIVWYMDKDEDKENWSSNNSNFLYIIHIFPHYYSIIIKKGKSYKNFTKNLSLSLQYL